MYTPSIGDKFVGTVKRITTRSCVLDDGSNNVYFMGYSQFEGEYTDKEDLIGREVVGVVYKAYDNGGFAVSRKPIPENKKAMQKRCFHEFVSILDMNEVLEATVLRIKDYGCFVSVEKDGIKVEGLLHITKMGDMNGKLPKEVYSTDDVVIVRVNDLDHDKGEIGFIVANEIGFISTKKKEFAGTKFTIFYVNDRDFGFEHIETNDINAFVDNFEEENKIAIDYICEGWTRTVPF